MRAISRCCAWRSRAFRTAGTRARRELQEPCPARTATRSRTATSARTCSTARAPAGTARSARLSSQVYAVRYAGDAKAQEIPLAHGVDRIEALGANAVVIGSDGRDLHFTSLRLAATAATPAGSLHPQGRGAGRDAQPRLLLQAGERQRRLRRPAGHRRGPRRVAAAAAGIGRGAVPAQPVAAAHRAGRARLAARGRRERRLPRILRGLVRQLAPASSSATACSR